MTNPTITRSEAQKLVNEFIKNSGLKSYCENPLRALTPEDVKVHALTGFGSYESYEFGPCFAQTVRFSINWDVEFYDGAVGWDVTKLHFKAKCDASVSASSRSIDEVLAYGELVVKVASLGKNIETYLGLFNIIPDPEAIVEHDRYYAEQKARQEAERAARDAAEEARRAEIGRKAAATRKANREARLARK